MLVSSNIATANAEGRLGLIIYVMPDYPNPSEFKHIAKHIAECGFVSAYETTDPVESDFGSHQTQSLKEAHLALSADDPSARRTRPIDLPSVYIAYESTLARYDGDWAAFLADNEGRFDALSFEGPAESVQGAADVLRAANVESVEAITPWMDTPTLSAALGRSVPNGIAYLSSADEAGGKITRSARLSTAADEAKSIRPDVKLVAGLGIRTADDVAAMACIPSLDAVVIGSAFVAAMKQGADAVENYLANLHPALDRH